jgi:hypothetical protein
MTGKGQHEFWPGNYMLKKKEENSLYTLYSKRFHKNEYFATT